MEDSDLHRPGWQAARLAEDHDVDPPSAFLKGLKSIATST